MLPVPVLPVPVLPVLVLLVPVLFLEGEVWDLTLCFAGGGLGAAADEPFNRAVG